MQDSV